MNAAEFASSARVAKIRYGRDDDNKPATGFWLVGNELAILNGVPLLFSHTSTRWGYISRRYLYCPDVYRGRYGYGAIVSRNNPNSTAYYLVDYYIALDNDLYIRRCSDGCALLPDVMDAEYTGGKRKKK